MKTMNEDFFKMNLQLFAEGENEASDSGSGENDIQDAQTGAEAAKTYTEEEVHALINKAVQERLGRYKRDEGKRMEAAKAEWQSEAEKLAQMTAEQRMEHERQKAEQAMKDAQASLAKREAEITRRELRSAAIDTLAEKGLPKGLEEILNYTDADACNASIDVVEKAFREAVQQGVNDRLKASGVRLSSNANTDATMIAAMRRAAGLPD